MRRDGVEWRGHAQREKSSLLLLSVEGREVRSNSRLGRLGKLTKRKLQEKRFNVGHG